MKFQISENSPVPLATQLKERIAIALSLGELRPGDTLPSIRDLEQSLGVGRAIIRRAYLELTQQGLLEMKQGRRVSVRDVITPATDFHHLATKLDAIVQHALDRARKLNVNDVSFARYFLSRTVENSESKNQTVFVEGNLPLASKRAKEIAEAWGIPVRAVALNELGTLVDANEQAVHMILTSYYRVEQVLSVLESTRNHAGIKVIPLSIQFKPAILARINGLAPGSRVCLFSEPRTFERAAASYQHVYRQAFPDADVEFCDKEVTSEAEILKIIFSTRYALGMINTLLWEKLSEKARKHPKLLRSRSDIDRESLEAARVKAGIFAIPR